MTKIAEELIVDVEALKKRAEIAEANVEALIQAGLLGEALELVETKEKLVTAQTELTSKKTTRTPKTRWQMLGTECNKPISQLRVENFEFFAAMMFGVEAEGESGGSSDWGHKGGVKAMCLARRFGMLRKPWTDMVDELTGITKWNA